MEGAAPLSATPLLAALSGQGQVELGCPAEEAGLRDRGACVQVHCASGFPESTTSLALEGQPTAFLLAQPGSPSGGPEITHAAKPELLSLRCATTLCTGSRTRLPAHLLGSTRTLRTPQGPRVMAIPG